MTSTTTRIATVSIVHEDGHEAAKEAAIELMDQLGRAPDVVLVFYSAEYSEEAVAAGFWTEFPRTTTLVGCSAVAELGPDGALTHSVSALGMCLSGFRARALSIEGGSDGYAAGRALVAPLGEKRPDLIILLPDVLTLNATQVLRGIQSVFGADVKVIGGGPADMGALAKTTMIANQATQSAGAVALALYGPITLSAAARSGYTPVSTPLSMTRAERGNVVLEIDGKPALSAYLDILGPRRDQMPGVTVEYPIGIVHSGTAEPDLVRAVFGIDKERNALILGGDIPSTGELRILGAGRADVVAGARSALETALAAMQHPDLILVFSCISRRVILGPRYKEECAVLPANVPRLGFYTFGELSPVAGVTQHHESTFTIAAIRFGNAA